MNAKVIQVIKATVERGAGTPDDPCRIVTVYFTLDGKRIAEDDPSKPLLEILNRK